MDGFLVVDKPPGITSHDVVDVVRRCLQTRKVGHAGTLDPDATGVLVVGVGKATRLLSASQQHPKCYRATAAFGLATTTQDASGETIHETEASHLTEEDVALALKAFVGEIEQVPPMVSAVKVGGERLYKKARRGEQVERPARPVTIHSFELISFSPGARPIAELEVCCSSGTYIRTLIHDLGQEVGSGAHMRTLRRTRAGGFGVEEAIALDTITSDALRPLVEMLPFLSRVDAADDVATWVANGRSLPLSVGATVPVGEDERVVICKDAKLLAVYRRRHDQLVAETVIAR